ncbi:MAG: dephospho-CoA kinase, partial [Vicinamibacterales bacterium]
RKPWSERVLRVALTGGIATGKSYCLERFARRGTPVIDADTLARAAVAPGSPGLRAVEARFGAGILTQEGSLDRKALGRIVFADPDARAALERIVHPEVYRLIRDWLASLPQRTHAAVADIPLLYETGRDHDFDRVIVAACGPEEQVRRMHARDGLSDADARARLAAQWPIEEKIRRAWRAIWTDRGFPETDRQLDEVYEELVAAES